MFAVKATLPDDLTMLPIRVPWLSAYQNPESYGWILLVNHAKPQAITEWWFNNVLVSYITTLRDSMKGVLTAEQMRAVLWFDGEVPQLNGNDFSVRVVPFPFVVNFMRFHLLMYMLALMSDKIVKSCSELSIELAKHAARCSGIQQANDVSRVFITFKTLTSSGKYSKNSDELMKKYLIFLVAVSFSI